MSVVSRGLMFVAGVIGIGGDRRIGASLEQSVRW